MNAAFWSDPTCRNLPDDLHQGGFPLESIGAGSLTSGQMRIGGEPCLLEAIGACCAPGESGLRVYNARARLIHLTRLDPAGRPRARLRIERDAAGRVVRELIPGSS